MQSSAIPAKFQIPFANSAAGPYIRTIPLLSQVGVTPGAASLTDGFPPVTFIPEDSGGTPPFGQDFNGLLNQITQWTQWNSAGAQVPYDAAFQTAIGGYPKGALVLANAGTFWYQSTVENNMTNPNAAGAGWQSVIPASPATVAPLIDGAATPGISLLFARQDHVHPTDTSRAALAYVNSTFETIAVANSTFLPKVNPVATGNMVINGDLYVSRFSAPNTGLILLNAAADRYLYYDGTNYVLAVAELYVNNQPVAARITTAQSAATAAGSAAATAQGTANTGVANAAAAQATANSSLAAQLGLSQTYVDVIGSRTFGVTYTNSTARPIYVYVHFTSASGAKGLSFNVNGIIGGSFSAIQNNSEGLLHFIVPSGNTYIVNTAGFVNLVEWKELR